MIALLQRVRFAQVTVADEVVAEIQGGLLVFWGFEQGDTWPMAEKLLAKVLAYRVFSDEAGKMNLSLTDKNLSLLLVPQFTLAAETKKGLRPNFSQALAPDLARDFFNKLVLFAKAQHPFTQAGIFAAEMQVYLCNDGPVTFYLREIL
jgi:D-tyrosyl-tRNA(Tyr) deacylase